MNTIEGSHDATGLRFGLVVSRFNEFVTERLLASATETLQKAGASGQAIDVVRVPGAFEIPLAAKRLARSGRFDAVICLGAVIRGETPHFEYVSAEASRGIANAAWEADCPVIFGVLTTDTVEQALARAGPPERNKGAEAARAAVEMVTLLKQLPKGEARSVYARRSRARRPRARRRGR
jgi:6,7-dimethyl-8-ribityllumazine synthase